jgi:hypothetical protein
MRHASRRDEPPGGEVDGVTEPDDHGADVLPDFDPAVLTDLDVRDDLRSGREPMARILAASDALPTGGVLHLRTPFEPAPLFYVLSQRGFAHHTEAFAADDWSSWFWHSESPPVPAAPTKSLATALAPPGVIDLRHLPPPEPLVAILARITRDDAPFEVMLPFDPPILDALLAQQGWRVERVNAGADGAQLRIVRQGSG